MSGPENSYLPTELPKPGQLVQVRSRRWLVEEVIPPDPTNAGNSPIVRLACVDDDSPDRELEVYWNYEPDRMILKEEGWRHLAERDFDKPEKFAAFFNTARWNAVTAIDPNLFQAPFRAGIKIEPYQMEPLRKALRLPRVNLFIADDTGLGKTIEAALIARELILRRKVKTIVVSAPPSMLEQWQSELEDRFGLLFEIIDRSYLAKIRRERGFGVNPWRTHNRFLISHRLLIDPTYTDPMREWLGTFKPGSLLILDEAHHAAPASGNRYGIETKFTRAVRDLAGRFEHRLFLSATPHNGHSNSFSTLMEILDPHRFTRGVKIQPKALEEVLVRRLKEDLRAVQGGFPLRKIVRIELNDLPDDAPELVLSRLLDEYRTLREKRFANAPKRIRNAAALLIVGLQQRLLSSIEAFARSLKVHRQTVLRQREKELQKFRDQLSLGEYVKQFTSSPDADDERAELPDEDLQREEEKLTSELTSAVELQAPPPDQELWEKEQELLDEMEKIAEKWRYKPDAKTRYLIDWIRENLCPGLPPFGQSPDGPPPKWLPRRVIIFTENRQGTKTYLYNILREAIAETDRADERIEVIDGLTSSTRRREIQRRFNSPPEKDPLRILIATDAAREGLNFQAHCADLFHFDLPWNPGRIEQRNGRIDRKLQPSPEVRCHYFVLPQRIEDRVLEVLVKKTEIIKRELGSLSKVIDDTVERLLQHGISHREAEKLAKRIENADIQPERKEAVSLELESTRKRREELQKQIDECQKLLEKSKKWLNFQAETFREALSCSLEILGASPLQEKTDENGRKIYIFPDTDKLSATDPTWLSTIDSLRPPKKREQKITEWRRQAPIRPIIFEDTGTLTDQYVQLHLEHRIAQRLLSRFRAQGFVYFDLSRACLLQTFDSTPRVVLIGRLSLYGQKAERLHEEIITVSAKWSEPSERSNLTPYPERAEGEILQILQESFSNSKGFSPPKGLRDKLLRSAKIDIQQLRPHLERRAESKIQKATKLLEKRGKLEAKALQKTLEQQLKLVEKQLKDAEKKKVQLELFTQEERNQFDADTRFWKQKLIQLERDIQREPQKIEEFYKVKVSRFEPIGIVYLWPKTEL